MSMLNEIQTGFLAHFDGWVKKYLDGLADNADVATTLYESEAYSLNGGGKRFRPFFCFLIFRVFSEDIKKIANWCLAIEMIHTYSLIHDDLPCMDNDDYRRGKLTNHKVYGEDMALLAGDGLLSDAFGLIAEDVHLNANTKVQLIKMLSQKIGSSGMVSGQVFDMEAKNDVTIYQLERIHRLKTANLIQAAGEGAAYICNSPSLQHKAISELSFHVGMAFQIKDDLLDLQDNAQDFKNFGSVIGLSKAQTELELHSHQAEEGLKQLQGFADINLAEISQLINYNLNRKS